MYMQKSTFFAGKGAMWYFGMMDAVVLNHVVRCVKDGLNTRDSPRSKIDQLTHTRLVQRPKCRCKDRMVNFHVLI